MLRSPLSTPGFNFHQPRAGHSLLRAWNECLALRIHGRQSCTILEPKWLRFNGDNEDLRIRKCECRIR
eukprot:12867069-Heterocapsa_arctica.AAC.1